MRKRILTLAMAAVLALSMVACGSTASKPTETPKSVDLSAFGEKYVTEQLIPNLLDTQSDIGKEILEQSYPDLDQVELEQCLPYIPMMNVKNSELMLVQVKNSADVEKVEQMFQTRIDNMVNGGAFYPGDVENWTNHSEVITNGNYVMLVVNTDKDAIVEEFNALFQ